MFSSLHLKAISNCTIFDICCVDNKTNRNFWTTVNLIELESIMKKACELSILLTWFYSDRDVVFSVYPKYDENLLFVQIPVNEFAMTRFQESFQISVDFLANNMKA